MKAETGWSCGLGPKRLGEGDLCHNGVQPRALNHGHQADVLGRNVPTIAQNLDQNSIIKARASYSDDRAR